MRKYRFITRGRWGVIQKFTKRTWKQKLFSFDWSTEYEWKDFGRSTDPKWEQEFFNRNYKDIEL